MRLHACYAQACPHMNCCLYRNTVYTKQAGRHVYVSVRACVQAATLGMHAHMAWRGGAPHLTPAKRRTQHPEDAREEELFSQRHLQLRAADNAACDATT